MEKALLNKILLKYREGRASPAESAFVEAYYAALAYRADPEDVGNELPSQEVWQAIGSEIDRRLDAPARRPAAFRIWLRMAGAAAILLAIGAGILVYVNRSGRQPVAVAGPVKDIAPGKLAATLTLADGSKVRLSDSTQGEIANQLGVSVTKTASGQLVYKVDANSQLLEQSNTLTTGLGETYQVLLPDGTAVWLNASSSLTYAPGAFSQAGSAPRQVRLTGEAYFEVARRNRQPFIVQASGQEVAVLGTHFNISAYPEDPAITTTLMEGSVKVSSGAGDRKVAVVLQPNEQSTLSGGVFKVRNVQAESAIDWKNGYFDFNYETLESIMTKLGRWYAVKVIYEDASVKNEIFLGSISRYEKISRILNLLERTDLVSFQVEGNTIIVRKRSTSH